ncbi:hypothetical protein ACFL1W_01100 [Candidatus Margulisiibacteriota bacterium]
MKKIIAVLGLVVLIATASSALNRYGVEAVAGAIFPYMGWQISDTQAIDVGLGYTSTNNGGVTTLTLGGKYTQSLAVVNKVKLNWYGMLGIGSVNTGASTTTLTLLGGLGAEYMITEAIGIYGDIDLLTIQSMSGAATGTNFFLVQGDFNYFSGIRIYI